MARKTFGLRSCSGAFPLRENFIPCLNLIRLKRVYKKDAKYSSVVKRGEGEALVCNTGKLTVMGKTASMVASVQKSSR